MIKKFLAVSAVVAMLLLIPYAIAQSDDDSNKPRERLNAVKDRQDSPNAAAAPARERLAEALNKRNEALQKEAFAKLNDADKTRFRNLDSRRLEKISALDADKVSKLKAVSKDRLRVVAAHADRLAGLEQADLAKAAQLDRSRIKELAALSPENAAGRLKNIRIVKANEDFKIRPLATGRITAAAAAHKRIQDKKEELRAAYAQRIDKVKAAKEKLRNCEGDCDTVRQEAIDRAREAALNVIERLTNHIEKIKERVSTSQDLSEEEIADRIAKLDSLLEEVSSVQAAVEAAATKEELNAAVKELRQIVAKIKIKTNAHAQGLVRARVIGIVHSGNVIEKKLDCSLAALEEEGADTSEIDVLMDEYSRLMAAAREKAKEAKDVFEKEDEAAVEAARQLIIEARESAKQAHNLLPEIRAAIAKLGGGGAACEEAQEIAIEAEADAETEQEIEAGDEKNETDTD
ncbi:hypothetical protein HYX10_00590 [Candidatus Woesearchaeota archaeon]|nr:hypothetical protein [Candidatus Woesearchaeota archaeon]